MLQYVAFYRKYRDLFVGAKDAGNVAVLRSFPSIAYNHATAQLSAILVEQALLQSRIPFDLIFDQHVKDLSKYRVVVLPDSECLSDQQVAALRAFVEKGGGLVATGSAGKCNEWRISRADPLVEGLMGRSQSSEGGAALPRTSPFIKECGQGRVVHIPSVQFDGPLPEMEPCFPIGKKFWKRPKNWQEITDAVCWAARGQIPLQVSGPDYLVAHMTSQPEKRRLLVHLVNFDAQSGKSVDNVTCWLPAQVTAKEVMIYSPDAHAPLSIPVTDGSNGATFTVPQVKVYTIAVVSW